MSASVNPDRLPNDPTEEQIRERAAEVRQRWSSNVKRRRFVGDQASWRPPLVLLVEVVREMNTDSA